VGADRLRFAVLGPGGVGGFLAGLLIRAGDSVVVLAGEETSRAPRRRWPAAGESAVRKLRPRGSNRDAADLACRRLPDHSQGDD